jgi:flagellar biogenesis protein FliO
LERERKEMREITRQWLGRLSGWLLERVPKVSKSEPRLAVIERIALTPRQSLVLVEAEGRGLLVATSQDGPPAFHALDPNRPGSNSYDSIPVVGVVS